jgi:hypothetical protein
VEAIRPHPCGFQARTEENIDVGAVAHSEKDQAVREAFAGAKTVSTQFYDVGAYPVAARYQSS